MSLPDFRQIANQINADVPDFGDIASGINNDPLKIARDLNRSVTDEEPSPLDFLEFLQAGEFLTAGITNAIIKDADLLKSIQEKHTFSELVNEFFPEAPKSVRVVGGFMASVLFDPLTYVGIGVLTKAGKAAKIAGTLKPTASAQALARQRSLFKIAGTDIGITGPIAARAFEGGAQIAKTVKLIPGVSKVSNAFKNAFVVGHKLKKVPGGEIVISEKSKARRALARVGREIRNEENKLKELIPEKGIREQLRNIYEDKNIISDDMINKYIAQMSNDPEAAAIQLSEILIDNGQKALNAKELQALQITYNRLVAQGEKQLLARNIITPEALEKFKERGIRYFPHIKAKITGTKSLQEIQSILVREKSLLSRATGKDLKRRRELDGLIDNIHEQLGFMIFEPDLARAVGQKGMQMAVVTNAFDLVENIIKKGDGLYTKPLKTIEVTKRNVEGIITKVKGFAEPDVGYVTISGDKTGLTSGIQIREEVADDLTQWIERFSGKTEGQIETFLQKFYDPLQDVWKSYTLGLFPAYHFRNALANVHNNTIVGVWNPQRYVDAAALQRGSDVIVKGVKYTSKQIKNLMEDENILRTGSFLIGSDIEEGMIRALRQGNTMNLVSRKLVDNPVMNFAFGVGEKIENNAKIANFIDGLGKGLNPSEAGLRAKKALFDYSELTRFEKKVMKRFFPFYTWTRKNIPLQIEAIATRPLRAALIPKAKDAFEEASGGKPNTIFMSDFLKDSFAIRTRKNGAQQEFFLLRNWLPTADILELLSPIDLATQMTTPILKAPAQWISNYNFFFKRKIERVPGELGEFVGISMRRKIIDALKNIRLLNELDRQNPFNVFGKERPFRIDLPGGKRFLSFATGLKLYAADEEKSLMYFIVGLRREIQERKSALRKAQARKFNPEIQRLLQEIDELQRTGAAALATQER